MACQDPIPLGQKSAYALGVFVNNLQAAALPAMLVILNLGLGMNPALVGLATFVPRLFDAISDPILGYLSDHTRSRWGRRRPYILAGAISSGLVFAAMWQLPVGHSERFYFWFFMTASTFYFVIYTLYATPLIALGLEMTSDYHERTSLHAFANTVGQLAWVGVPWFYAIMASRLFVNKVHGARVLALWVGAALCVLGALPAIFCREGKHSFAGANELKNGSGVSKRAGSHASDVLNVIRDAFRCRPFVQLCAATFLVFNGFQLGAAFSLYVIKYYVFSGDDEKAGALFGSFGTLTAVCALGGIPLSAWISSKIGKRDAFLVVTSISLFGYVLKWFCYDPDHPYGLLASCPFIAFGVGSLFTLMGSMVADVCDFDELGSHQRREGVFSAIYWWMVKLGMALEGLLAGVMLNATGFDVKLSATQTDQTLLWLRIFDVFVPLATSAIGVWVMTAYPITESRAHKTRQTLERRRRRTENVGKALDGGASPTFF